MRWRHALMIAGGWQGACLLGYGWLTRWCFCSTTGAPAPRTAPDAVIGVLRLSEYPLAWMGAVIPLDWLWSLFPDPVPALLLTITNALLTAGMLMAFAAAVRIGRRKRLDRSPTAA